MSPVQCYAWWCPSVPSGGDIHLPCYHHATFRGITRFTSSSSRRPADIGDETRQRQRAALLGIGTANPANCVRQDEYADWYFNVTGSEHLTYLKTKMKKMCDKSGIHRRYFRHSESTIREHPILLGRGQPSLDARQDMLASAVPELAAAAAEDTIAEWGRPATDITDLVVSTYSGAHMPGAVLHLASLLGLRPSVRRTMLNLQGCTAGGAVLRRIAKDIAKNIPGPRVLVACAELTLVMFRAPDEARPGTLVMQSMFADGASAAVVGPRAEEPVELPIYEMVSASQVLIPETSVGRAAGVLVFHPSSGMPAQVRQNIIERCVADALQPVGLGHGASGCNDLFWAVLPSGRAIVDAVEAGLAVLAQKLAASRRVLREYGYMSGATMLFVLDELRRRPARELGVMLAIGPGISVETMVLRMAGARES